MIYCRGGKRANPPLLTGWYSKMPPGKVMSNGKIRYAPDERMANAVLIKMVIDSGL